MPNLELANFTCRFGEEKVMKDFYRQIVLPAFKTKKPRKWKNKAYVLHQVDEKRLSAKNNIDKDISASVVIGRIVKNTTLTSRQVMVNGELIQRRRRLSTSPSSFFILYTESHKLIFVREMPYAPTISDFEFSMAWFLKQSHKDFLRTLQERIRAKKMSFLDKDGSPINPTLKNLEEAYPKPTVTITNIGTPESLKSFIESYGILKNVSVELLPVNDELDSDDLFKALRAEKEKLKSKTTTLLHRNNDGLDKVKVADHLSSINAAGNHRINTSGEDPNGNLKKGSNEDFKLQRPIPELPLTAPEAADFLHAEIVQMADAGLPVNVVT